VRRRVLTRAADRAVASLVMPQSKRTLCLLLILVVALTPAAGAGRANASDAETELAYILVDAQGGTVLEENLADREMPAAGTARLLVALLTLEQVHLDLFDIDDPVTISTEVAALESGLLRLDPQRTYPLGELLRAILVAGAPDATLALAEGICGSLATCFEMMKRRAGLLGMKATRPPPLTTARGEDMGSTTPRDAARLVRALLAHPETVRWSSLPGIPFADGPVVLRNTNSLVGTIVGVDGLQVARSGSNCNIMATAKRRGSRVVAVVGGEAPLERCYERAAKLIEDGFRSFASVELVREGETLKVSIEVDGGTVEHIAPVATRSFSYFQKRNAPPTEGPALRYQLPLRIIAPIERDAIVGELIVEMGGRIVAVIPARTPQRVGRSGLF